MRTRSSRQSAAVQNRTWLLLVVLGVVAGGALLMVYRPGRPVGRGGPAPAWPDVLRTNLVFADDRFRTSPDGPLFTGFVIERYADGALRSRSAVSNGLLHGLSQGWYTNGQLQVAEPFTAGVADGLRTKWYADGTTQSVATIAGGKLNGTFRRWHTNGVLSEQAEFVADHPDGVSTAWYPSGYLKARVFVKSGEAAEQRHWADGEKRE